MGIRNSHDKHYSLGLISGRQVRVCSNGLFNSTINVSRKHHGDIMLNLPGMITKAVGDFSLAAQKQQEQIACYKQAELSTMEANDLLVKAVECDAISGSKLSQVIKAYNTPPHPEFQDRNVWSLVNAFTEVYKNMTQSFAPRLDGQARRFRPCRLSQNHGWLRMEEGSSRGITWYRQRSF